MTIPSPLKRQITENGDAIEDAILQKVTDVLAGRVPSSSERSNEKLTKLVSMLRGLAAEPEGRDEVRNAKKKRTR